jgi:hypothetical protein
MMGVDQHWGVLRLVMPDLEAFWGANGTKDDTFACMLMSLSLAWETHVRNNGSLGHIVWSLTDVFLSESLGLV